MERTKRLGESYWKTCEKELIQRSPRYDTVDLSKFKAELESLNPQNVNMINFENVPEVLRTSSERIHGVARRHIERRVEQEGTWDRTLPREIDLERSFFRVR